MKAIIENGKINDGIQSCFISEYGGRMVIKEQSAKIPYKIDCTSESSCQVWQ